MLKRVIHVLYGALMMVLGLVVAAFLISILFVVSQFGGNADFPVECAVVFGSAVHHKVIFDERKGTVVATAVPGPGIRRRTETAVHLLREGSVERLIFTGGLGEGNQVSEARVMRNEALRLGVTPEFIQMEEGATSTWQNVKFVLPHVQDCDSLVGISDRYHLARIRIIAWLQEVPMAVHPAEDTANLLFEIQSVLREALGNIAYLMSVLK